MPVSLWLMLLIFWWKSTNWCVSLAEGLAGRSNHLIFARWISCERGRQLACCDKVITAQYVEYCVQPS